jgi:hypothetical protein
MKTLCTFILLASLSGCCRENCANTYIIQGTVSRALDGTPSVGFAVELEEQVLENGVLNGFFTTAATTTTDASGYYYMEFQRKNALAYRLNVEYDGWFPIEVDVHPENFTPDVPHDVDLVTTPIAELEIHVINAPPSVDTDKMRVRLLKSFTEFSNCHTEWVVMNGEVVDTTWGCVLPGNTWMPYLSIDQSEDDEIVNTDSVFCVEFEKAVINVIY